MNAIFWMRCSLIIVSLNLHISLFDLQMLVTELWFAFINHIYHENVLTNL